MLFSHSKLGHIGQILSTGAAFEVSSNAFTPPTAGELETFIHLIIQVIIGLVTIWATVRKMLQKPEQVVKAPAAGVVVVPAAPVVVEPVTPPLPDASK